MLIGPKNKSLPTKRVKNWLCTTEGVTRTTLQPEFKIIDKDLNPVIVCGA